MNWKSILGVLTLTFMTSHAVAKPELNVYAWGGYIPTDAIKCFEQQQNVVVNYSTFENNESMYTKMKLVKGQGYDVVFASAYFIQKLARENLVAKLDHQLLPNMHDSMEGLLNQAHDPNNQYSLPYIWGITGISYNSAFVEKPLTKWADLWSSDFEQQVMLIDDVRDVFGMTLKMLGYSANSTNPDEIEQAYQALVQLQNNIVVYNSDAPQVPYISGEVAAGMQWNGNAYQGMSEMPELAYIFPEEGPVMWMDNMLISAGSSNPILAHAFINHMYTPQVQAEIVQTLGYASATNGGKALLPNELKNNAVIYPAQNLITKGEFTVEVDEKTLALYQSYWQRLRL